jgi:hypothetical protein
MNPAKKMKKMMVTSVENKYVKMEMNLTVNYVIQNQVMVITGLGRLHSPNALLVEMVEFFAQGMYMEEEQEQYLDWVIAREAQKILQVHAGAMMMVAAKEVATHHVPGEGHGGM